MKTEIINGKTYRLPGNLSQFQKEMYVHLIDYKWDVLKIPEPGIYNYKKRKIPYDAIIPDTYCTSKPLVYQSIKSDITSHQGKFPFKEHTHFNHMASSQAANINLFVPVLLSPIANQVLSKIKSDFDSLNTSKLYKGFQIEYWDGSGKDKGLLGDHNARSGTDSDIAIAYTNKKGESCLWLIEHKLTEKEFTTCGGAKSDNRNKAIHNCNQSFSSLLKNKDACYYHNVRHFNYWEITEQHKSFFQNQVNYEHCPFKGGMNQLWRNQLLGLALEARGDYEHVYFSVVHHPDNHALDKTINEYKMLTNNNPKFSSFISKDVVDAARQLNDPSLNSWVEWYKKLYKI